jgi:hypothetical protein
MIVCQRRTCSSGDNAPMAYVELVDRPQQEEELEVE